MRTWWEDNFSTPSAGNALWEDVPFASHVETFINHQLFNGRDVLVEEGIVDGELMRTLRIVDGPVTNRILATDGVAVQKTGDKEFDEYQDRLSRGLNPWTGLPLKSKTSGDGPPPASSFQSPV